MDSRLNELESRIAFQDLALQELSDVVARQQREIAGLRLAIEALHAQIQATASVGGRAPADEPPPPHY